MSADFHDIDIPPRATEYALPLDTSIDFRFQEDPAGLRLVIFAAGEEREYGGRGRILLPGGYIRLQELSLLDPFLLEKTWIPARYFKIFFRAQLPRLMASGVQVNCALQLAATPAVLFTIRACTGDVAEYDLRWYVQRDAIRTVSGFEGYVLAGNTVYRGLQQELRAVPHVLDGAYTARGEELRRLRELYSAAPYLFDVRDAGFLERKPNLVAETVDRIREAVTPRRKLREWGGPALLRTGVTPQNRSGTSRFVHFVVEAKRLADAPARPAEFVPFTCYWPTYANMSREQRAWYFYWRDAFYHGKVLKTDLSYIFVAVYEIINRAYPVGLESFERMLSLWEAYRDAFPRLDYYMSQWCVDYILTNDLTYDFEEILRRIPLTVANMRPFLELYVNNTLETGLHALPFDVLCEFSEYHMKNSRFYKGHEELCRDATRTALAEIDRGLRAAKQMGLLSYLSPLPKREVWDSYQGAVCGRAAAKRIEVEYLPFSKNARIRSFVGSVMRYVENALRKREKYAGRLRGIALTEAVQHAIDRSLAGKTEAGEKTPDVVIDLSRAAELERDSWDNTRRLIEAVEDAQPEREGESWIPFDGEPAQGESPLEPAGFPDEDLSEPETLPDMTDGWTAFIETLEPIHRTLLQAMLAGADEAALSKIATQAFSFPEALYDEINERAADTLGDILIDAENHEIYEEHRAGLAAVL